MKLLVLFLFGIISTVFSQECPGLEGNPPSQQNLVFCVEYSASACCTPASEQLVIANMQRLNGIYGNTSCYTNMRNLACAMACSPSQAAIISVAVTTYTTITGYLDPTFVSGWYGTCAPACIVPVTNYTVAEVTEGGNLTIFVYLFSTDAIQGFTPSLTNPRTIYNIGAMQNTGTDYNTTVNTGSNQFLPCPKVTATTATGTAATGTAATGTATGTAATSATSAVTTAMIGTTSSVSNLIPSLALVASVAIALRFYNGF